MSQVVIKKRDIYTIILFILIIPNLALPQDNDSNKTSISIIKSKEIPIGLQCLLRAYPEYLNLATVDRLIWKDGTEMIFDDGIRGKNYETLLNFPDLEDQLSIPYPVGQDYSIPLPKNFDPGRIRYEPFFLKMYGNSIKKVQANLVSVFWLPKTVNKRLMITSINRVNEKLQMVSKELDELPNSLKKYVVRINGTFNWRKISEIERFSTHSFGIAIDINTEYGNYWQWDNPNPNDDQQYKNQIPIEIVEIFEKYGFIWGGKWYHYDTIHFEYRPELLLDLGHAEE